MTVEPLTDSYQLTAALTAVQSVVKSPYVVLYIGPDQIMPLTSVLGAIAGLALMFWQYLVSFARRSRAFVMRRFRGAAREQQAIR